MTERDLPYVSVIIPVYNNANMLKTCLANLQVQTYPEDKYEIIVVDNGSRDNSMETAKQYTVLLLEEKEVQSSYAARNRGLHHAKGEIVAFIDSDCMPVNNWIEEGVKSIIALNADLAGGKVTFTFTPEKSAAEILDAIIVMQIEENIRERGVAITANLFVRRNVFNKIGLFPSYVRSGGDVKWTGEATKQGFTLIYAENAEVLHPARKLGQLLKKQYRVGEGQAGIWLNEGHFIADWFKTAKREVLFPFKKKKQKANNYKRRNNKHTIITLLKSGCVGILCIAASNLGRINSLLASVFSKK